MIMGMSLFVLSDYVLVFFGTLFPIHVRFVCKKFCITINAKSNNSFRSHGTKFCCW